MTFEDLLPHLAEYKETENTSIVENIIDADNVFSQDTLEYILNNDNYEILGPNNTWSDFKGVKKISRPNYIVITLENGEQIKGSPWHRILVNKKNNRYEYLGFLKQQESYVDYHGKLLLVTDKKEIVNNIELFDILDVNNKDNNFMLGKEQELTSHNCAAIDARRKEAMEEIWSAAGITLTKSKGSCFAISCVTADTFIFTDKGIQQIGDLIERDNDFVGGYEINKYKILGHKGFRTSNLFKNNGLGKTFKLTNRFSELEAHEDHKIYAYSNGKYGYYKISELKVGDYVNIKKGMEVWGNNNDISDFKPTILTSKAANIFRPTEITPDLAYFLGLYIAEGNMTVNLTNGWVDITCGDKEITSIFDKLNLRYTTHDNLHFRVCSKNLIELMLYLGFKQEKAPLKEIPKRLLQCSRDIIISILQGLFDGDGCIYLKGNKPLITLTSTSEKLINQVRIILANLGILSGKYKYDKENDKGHLDKNNKLIKMNHDRFTLELNNYFSTEFINKVNFRLERKKNKSIGKNLSYKVYQSQIPNEKELIDKLYEEGNTGSSLRRNWDIRIDNKKISSSKINNILPILKDENFKTNAKEYYLFEDDSIWVTIDKLEEKTNYTYDVSLPNIENDFWCHSVIHSLVNSCNTPKGASGWYYDQYINAEKNGWNIISAHWSEHPEYSKGMYQWIRDDSNKRDGGYLKRLNDTWPDIKHKDDLKKYGSPSTYNYIKDGKLRSPWYDVESSKLSPSKIACELDCSFASSGTEVLAIQVRAALTTYAMQFEPLKLKIKTGYWNDYHQFKSFIKGRKYLLSADSSTGDGADNSAFIVIDYTDMDSLEIVASFASNTIDPYTFGSMIEIVAKGFGYCEVLIEHQIGITTLLHLKNTLKYPYLYYHTLKSRNTDLNDKNAKRTKLGLWQDEETRTLGGDELETLVSTIISSPFKKQHMLKIPCKRIVKEMQNWVWRKGRRDHAPSTHDDLIMCIQNAIFVIKYSKLKLQNRAESLKNSSLISKNTKTSAIETKVNNERKVNMSKSNVATRTGRSGREERNVMLSFD